MKSGNPEEAVNYLLGVLTLLPPLHAHGGAITPDQSRALPISSFGLGNGYRALSQSYLELHAFKKALEAAEASLFYNPNNPAGMLFKSLALYSLDRPLEANNWFDRAHAIYLPTIARNAEELRKKYLEKLCKTSKGKPQITCRLMPQLTVPASGQSPAKPAG